MGSPCLFGPRQRPLQQPVTQHPLVYYHGRYYGNWRLKKYLFPVDAEELERLDIFHKFFLVARDNALSVFNLSKVCGLRVLDLGTGTSLWAINVCDQFEHFQEVMAVDINLIQPYWIPPRMTTVQFDIEDPDWSSLLPNCDLVHVRTLRGSIKDLCWPTVYRNILGRLKPGTGYLEQVEIDWSPRWEKSGEVPANSALKEWADNLLAGLDRCNRSARIESKTIRRWIEQAGFVDFQEQTVKCYVNPWSPNQNEKETAIWFNLGLSRAMEAMGLMPMIEQLGMTAGQVRDLCSRAVDENRKLKYHVYCTLYIWTARRPRSGDSANVSQQALDNLVTLRNMR